MDQNGNETSVEQLVDLLKSIGKENDFKISLCVCSGINVGRNLIDKMQKAGLYGTVTARNYSVYPSLSSGNKYNIINKNTPIKRVITNVSLLHQPKVQKNLNWISLKKILMANLLL
ncbi:hypothetical protein [Legionella tunisiensis]|uniref:hypothetical protein n=1 Tax=Legionella tunisiensis TaxID=1034944 RepID=UPI00035E52B2|nr:hypothetical protein [Legionella tunisiensis]